jgi:hypothetical protein
MLGEQHRGGQLLPPVAKPMTKSTVEAECTSESTMEAETTVETESTVEAKAASAKADIGKAVVGRLYDTGGASAGKGRRAQRCGACGDYRSGQANR